MFDLTIPSRGTSNNLETEQKLLVHLNSLFKNIPLTEWQISLSQGDKSHAFSRPASSREMLVGVTSLRRKHLLIFWSPHTHIGAQGNDLLIFP